jgi:hypothetical protein
MTIYVINYLGKESYNELGHAHHLHLHPPLLHPQVSQLKGLSRESQACSLGVKVWDVSSQAPFWTSRYVLAWPTSS